MKKIAILTGGPGVEKEIAEKSAQFFIDNINREHDVYILPEQIQDFIKNKDNYSLAIPVFHGEYGEDGKIFAFLDILGIPHTFSSYDVHSLCLDKFKTNIIVEKLGVFLPEQYIYDYNNPKYPDNYPVIMKPNNGGSSFYTYKIDNQHDFDEKIKIMHKEVDDLVLIQEYITGDEYSVPVVNREVLPVMMLEKKSQDSLFDYTSKYESEDDIKETFPELEPKLKQKFIENTLKIYNFLNIKGFCRVDFILRGEKLYFLEVNTIPGMTNISILPKAWRLTERDNTTLVDTLLKK